MWDFDKSKDTDWEPIELRLLKRQLAKNNCQCTLSSNLKTGFPRRKILKEQEVQVDEVKIVGNHQAIEAVERCLDLSESHRDSTVFGDISCPSCFITMQLLRMGIPKVLKDEESETDPEKISSCDKYTDSTIVHLEQSTSFTSPENTDSVTTDMDYSVESIYPKGGLKRDKKEVTFREAICYQDEDYVCVDRYVQAIMPTESIHF